MSGPLITAFTTTQVMHQFQDVEGNGVHLSRLHGMRVLETYVSEAGGGGYVTMVHVVEPDRRASSVAKERS